MKRLFLFFTFSILFIDIINATTKTWTATAVQNNWINDTSWTPFGQPTLTDDVIIPTGSVVPASGFYCYMKTCTMQGNAVIDLSANFQVIDTILIPLNAVFNWTSGEFNGGGKMRNKGTVNILNNGWFSVVQGNNVINNEGTINLPKVNNTTNTSNFALLNGIINNLATGIIDIKGNGNSLYVSTGNLHQVNNWGTIKKTAGTGNNDFSIFLHNYPSGKINVDSGSIKLVNYTDTLEGGTYNVAPGSQLIINAETYYYGSLTGVLNGEFILQGTIRVPTTASFDFTGTSNVLWHNGELSNGGMLTNNSKMIINPICGLCAKYNGLTTLTNNNEVTIMNNSLVMGTGFFTNNATGIVTLNDGAGFYRYLGGTHALINYGIIQKNNGSGAVDIDLDSTINMGVIDCNSGTIKINSWGANHFINKSIGIIKGNAAFEFPGNQYSNNGTTSPGGNTTDTLWINNNSQYHTSDSSILDIQLNGTTQGVTYDYLNITNGNADFAGKVKVTLGFAPAITDTFIVATCSGTITNCSIDSESVATFGPSTYTFKVNCVNNNSLVLSLKSKTTVGIDDNKYKPSISVYPNPCVNKIYIVENDKQPLKSISVYDLHGRFISNHKVNKQNSMQEISFETISSGTYIIKIQNEKDEFIFKKLIKM